MKKTTSWVLLILILIFIVPVWLFQVFKIVIRILYLGSSAFPNIGYAIGSIFSTIIIGILIIYGIVYFIKNIRGIRNRRK